MLESVARGFVGRNGAELDDLVQEGRLSIWQAVGRGVTPSRDIVIARMQDWVRYVGIQTGRGKWEYDDEGNRVEYLTLLPLDDFAGTLTLDPIPLQGFDPLA